MPKPIRIIIAFVQALFLCLAGSTLNSISAAEAKPGWQAEWDKTVKAAEDEGALVHLHDSGAFEPVFREAFQKKFPKIKSHHRHRARTGTQPARHERAARGKSMPLISTSRETFRR